MQWLSFIYFCKVPRERLKTLGFALGFQHIHLLNVNEQKIMLGPFVITTLMCLICFPEEPKTKYQKINESNGETVENEEHVS